MIKKIITKSGNALLERIKDDVNKECAICPECNTSENVTSIDHFGDNKLILKSCQCGTCGCEWNISGDNINEEIERRKLEV